jgi:UDP-N-acetylmuramoyl-tripeptide--D-alanyl-D-alanine ligase
MSANLTTAFVAADMRRRGYSVSEGPAAPITGGAADSRSVRPGDLFTAFLGENTDGNVYVADALRGGAVAAICERTPEGAWLEKTIVVAPNSRRAVGELAHAWRLNCDPKVVGITGTVGKTTAKELTASAVATRFTTHRSEGNLNSREGLPLALLSLRTGDEVSVLEMGMDSPGEILELCAIARPEIGVVLNIGLTHVSKLGTIEAIAAEKLSLARYLAPDGTAILNIDDPRVAEGAAGLRCKVITFGHGESAMLRQGQVRDHGLAGTEFDIAFAGESRTVRSPLPGAHTVPAALAAIAVCLALGMPFASAVDAIGAATVEGRVRRLISATGAIIIDDRYNASPASVAGALEMLARLPGRRIALLGKMAELGDFEAAEHRRAGEVAARSCDTLVSFGETCRPMVEAARAAGMRDARWFATKDEAAAAISSELRAGDHVLVKGSRSEALETILPVLEGAR